MKIFDSNIHLPVLNTQFETQIESELSLTLDESIERISSLELNLNGINIMIFNTKFNDHLSLKNSTLEKFENVSITQLLDIETFEISNYLNKVNAFKIHPYHQQLDSTKYNKLVEVCSEIQRYNLPICIDTSYGSNDMYKIKPLEIACILAKEIKNIPIILLHSGGLKCMEAMLLVLSNDNVFLETSFTYNYYYKSNISIDLKYIYNKIGPNKIIYGSDRPYVNYKDQLFQIKNLFKELNFEKKEIEKIFFKNSIELFGVNRF